MHVVLTAKCASSIRYYGPLWASGKITRRQCRCICRSSICTLVHLVFVPILEKQVWQSHCVVSQNIHTLPPLPLPPLPWKVNYWFGAPSTTLENSNLLPYFSLKTLAFAIPLHLEFPLTFCGRVGDIDIFLELHIFLFSGFLHLPVT